MPICPKCHRVWPTEYRYCPECQGELVNLPLEEGDQINIRSPKQTVVVNTTPPRMAGHAEVECEKCGQFNRIGNTFNCRGGCGRKFLCKALHFDKTFEMCTDCAAIRRGDAEQEAARQAQLQSDLKALTAQTQRLTTELAQLTAARDKGQSELAEALDNQRHTEEDARAAAATAHTRLADVQKTLSEWRARAEQAQTKLTQVLRAQDMCQAELSRAQAAAERVAAEGQAKATALEASLAEWRGRAEKAEGQLSKMREPQLGPMYQPGDILLNKYRIEASIGSGAFAQVYRAMHLALQAPRALKVLRRDAPRLSGTEFGDFRSRFRLEAQLGMRIGHPHVIRVHDFKQDGETLLLVLEYAAGGSLAERLGQVRQGGSAISTDEAVRIVREAAEGLTALHELDIVHRDLKPSNILFDEAGSVKVSDLGLAQVGEAPTCLGSAAGSHPGTPAYMSPEQQGTTRYLTPASDVYSLGVILFEMLTGRAYKSMKPGTRLKQLYTAAPAWLDELLARMLADEPRIRPWDGAEVVQALR